MMKVHTTITILIRGLKILNLSLDSHFSLNYYFHAPSVPHNLLLMLAPLMYVTLTLTLRYSKVLIKKKN